MSRRKPMSRKQSKSNFKRSTSVHPKNALKPMRGGIRF